MKKLTLFLIKLYRLFPSPPNTCRYYPTCSVYTYQAIDKYGILHGSILGLKRILNCHPWSTGGFDPVK